MKAHIKTLILLLSGALSLSAQVVPTNEWVSFWSDSCTINTVPIPIGSIVRAYDPQGVLCGQTTTTSTGVYGFMSVYRDDGTTPVDEGAQPGDTIHFTINNRPAIVKKSLPPVWTANGDVKKVILAVELPRIGITPLSLSFGTVPLKGNVTVTFQITNVGLKKLSVDSIRADYNFPSHFLISPTTASIDAGNNVTISVKFTPLLGSGNITGRLKIFSNDLDSAQFFLPFSGTIQSDVVPTNEWVSVWSDSTYFANTPVKAGDMIDAYDPQGIHCGTFTVTSPKSYGLMPIYRDDATTTGVDEGASPGDVLTFTVNGRPSITKGPDRAEWTTNGSVLKIHLISFPNRPPVLKRPLGTINLMEDAPPFDLVKLDTSFSDPDADSLQFTATSSRSEIHTTLANNKVTVQIQANFHGTGFITLIARDKEYQVSDTVTIVVASVNDPPGPFFLLSPAAGAILPDTTGRPTFRWTKSVDVDGGDTVKYEITYSKNRPFDGTAIRNTILDTLFVPPSSLTKNVRYYWSMRAFDGNGGNTYALGSDTATWTFSIGTVLSVEENSSSMPVVYQMSQNYPNPFNPSTTIRFALPTRSFVTLEVVNAIGQRVATLVNGEKNAGYHDAVWNAAASSGIYFLRIRAASLDNSSSIFFDVKKMVLMR